MTVVDLATAYTERSRRQKAGEPSINLMSEGFNAASNGAPVFAYIEADGENLKKPCFTFEAADMTAQQVMQLLGCWQKIIREK